MFSAIASINTTIFGKKEGEGHSRNPIMSAEEITLVEFREKLSKYPALIETFSRPGMFLFFVADDLELRKYNCSKGRSLEPRAA